MDARATLVVSREGNIIDFSYRMNDIVSWSVDIVLSHWQSRDSVMGAGQGQDANKCLQGEKND